ncbi:MAG: helix-turn-helix domain-containing protein [Acidimicrobiales bacterium]
MLVTTTADQDFDRWRALVSASFVPLHCEPVGSATAFDATMLANTDPDLQVVRITAAAHTVRRAAGDLGDGSSDLKISFVTQGRCRVAQGATDAVVATGGAALYHCDAPYELSMDQRFTKLVLQLDRREIETHTKVPTGHALTFDQDNLFMRCLRSIGAELTAVGTDEPSTPGAIATDDEPGRLVRQKMVELLALAIAGHTQGAVGAGPTRRQLYLQALEVVHTRLRDPELSPTTLAEAVNVSRRSLYKLFEENGQTVNDYIIHRRLEQARNELADPRNVDRTVTEIAMDLGFQSASHFSRRFAQAFQLAPSETRRS